MSKLELAVPIWFLKFWFPVPSSVLYGYSWYYSYLNSLSCYEFILFLEFLYLFNNLCNNNTTNNEDNLHSLIKIMVYYSKRVETSYCLALFIECTVTSALKNCSTLSHSRLSCTKVWVLDSVVTISQLVVFHHVLKGLLAPFSSRTVNKWNCPLHTYSLLLSIWVPSNEAWGAIM